MTTPTYYIVDHRYANSQIRYRLLQMLTQELVTLQGLETSSGLCKQHLISICLGKSGVSYMDMAKLSKGLFGDSTELMVIIPWVDCGFSYSGKEWCQEDAECEKLLKIGQQAGSIPKKVWENNNEPTR